MNLSKNGYGLVAPNPMVGAVIFHKETNKIIGEGYHKYYGGMHAEKEAIANVSDKSLLKDCTMFVNLEPCTHHGKTPPCTDLIIESNIRRIVVAALDPNPLVSGKGIKKLKAAGIKVEVGLLEKEARYLNRSFYIFHQEQRPYYILKWAQSLNGKMGKTEYEPRENKSVSGILSWKLSHKWRTENQAILVGVQTVITDNPSLNARLHPGNNPVILVLDPNLRTPERANIFATGSKVVIFNKTRDETIGNIFYKKISFDDNWTKHLSQSLFEMNIQSVLVEGGPITLNKFIEKGLWDEARIFQSDLFLDWDLEAPHIPGKLLRQERIGSDLYIQTYPNHEHSYFESK
jgi:diaminohydroxyphosphoribosylaminopyrimidine deaminase/5-amino-6-(5-phosphoribosylamino)uracil reductase